MTYRAYVQLIAFCIRPPLVTSTFKWIQYKHCSYILTFLFTRYVKEDCVHGESQWGGGLFTWEKFVVRVRMMSKKRPHLTPASASGGGMSQEV